MLQGVQHTLDLVEQVSLNGEPTERALPFGPSDILFLDCIFSEFVSSGSVKDPVFSSSMIIFLAVL
jgi:hypothetical protein